MAELRDDLVRVLGDLAFDMQAQDGNANTLHTIAEAGAKLVPGARWAGISRLEGRRVISEVPTDPIVEKLDSLQSELREGPCITALREQLTVKINDMAEDERWPRFARLATQLGVRSLLSFQLFVKAHNLGALNLYGTEAHAFTDESIEVGQSWRSTQPWRWRAQRPKTNFRGPCKAATSSARPRASSCIAST